MVFRLLSGFCKRPGILVPVIGLIALAAAAVSLLIVEIWDTRPPGQVRDVYVLHSSLTQFLQNSGSETRVAHIAFGGPSNVRAFRSAQFVSSVLQRVPGRLEWQVDLPRGKVRLEFTVAFRCDRNAVPGRVEITVAAEHDGGSTEIYRNHFWARRQDVNQVFYKESIPLDGFAGEKVTFIFESHSEGTAAGNIEIIWGNPTVSVRQRTAKPSVVLICVDALRRDRVGRYNGESRLTPNIDALAEDGVTFEHAISQAPWTLPSVASVLTGLPPSLHGAGKKIAVVEDPSSDQLEEMRKIAGIVPRIGDSYTVLSKLGRRVQTAPELLAGEYLTHMINGNVFIAAKSNVSPRFMSYADRAMHGYLVTQDALGWFEDHRDQLFFIYAHYMEPHEGGGHYRELVDHGAEEGKENARKVYDELTAISDAYVGTLIRALKEMNLYDSSLIIIYADHGEHMWDEAWENTSGHGNTFSNILLEVPLIVKFPGSEFAGKRVDDYVALTDIFMTTIEETGYRIEDPIYAHSLSLRRYAAGRDVPEQRQIFSEFVMQGKDKACIQEGQYRLIHELGGDRYILLDAASDKTLSVDSAPELEAIAARLKSSLDAYLKWAESRGLQAKPIEIGDEEAERLKQLGYIK